jgi:O-acetyl-ADP-ribose deacetylase (regulator of RNase III)
MKLVLLDINKEMTDAWHEYFDGEDIEIVNDTFENYVSTHAVQCIVSPANAYGLMDGGYDLAISNYYKTYHHIDIGQLVRLQIMEQYLGEQPVTSALMVPLKKEPWLLHCPTMRTPRPIKDPEVIYHCMRNTLLEARRWISEDEVIVIPAFGGATGRVSCADIARLMWKAYRQINNPPTQINWSYAIENKYLLKDPVFPQKLATT